MEFQNEDTSGRSLTACRAPLDFDLGPSILRGSVISCENFNCGQLYSVFAENDDSVGVGSVFVVFDTPAAGGFGEGVGVDQDFHGIKPGGFAAGEDMFFEEDFSSADFADFHGGVSARAEDALDFHHRGGEHGLPSLERTGAAGNGFRVDTCKPTAEPVIAAVINHIKEWRGGEDERDGVFLKQESGFRFCAP